TRFVCHEWRVELGRRNSGRSVAAKSNRIDPNWLLSAFNFDEWRWSAFVHSPRKESHRSEWREASGPTPLRRRVVEIIVADHSSARCPRADRSNATGGGK